MTSEKENPLMRESKNTVKLGMTSMVGMGALGAMSSIPGMPSQASQVTSIAGSGLTLLNVGQLAKSGQAVVETMDYKGKKIKKKVSKTDPIKKILGY